MSTIAHRTLELLSLFQAQRDWTGQALAERLGTTPRTVRRDIDRLREMGYQVDASRGPGGAYRLAAGSQLPPMIFDDEQAVAIALALQTAPGSVSGLGDATRRALSTVEDLLPPHLARRLRTIAIERIENAWDLAPPEVAPALLAELSSAAQGQRLVRFRYLARTTESAGDLEVLAEPYKLVVWAGRWYLIAYEQRGQSWHAYRLDRMGSLEAPGWHFRPRDFPWDDTTRFIQMQPDRGDAADVWPCRGTARMRCPVALVAKWAPGGATVESIDDETTRITMGAWSWAGLLGLLATFDSDFVVEEPPELVDAAQRIAARLVRAGDETLPPTRTLPSSPRPHSRTGP